MIDVLPCIRFNQSICNSSPRDKSYLIFTNDECNNLVSLDANTLEMILLSKVQQAIGLKSFTLSGLSTFDISIRVVPSITLYNLPAVKNSLTAAQTSSLIIWHTFLKKYALKPSTHGDLSSLILCNPSNISYSVISAHSCILCC